VPNPKTRARSPGRGPSKSISTTRRTKAATSSKPAKAKPTAAGRAAAGSRTALAPHRRDIQGTALVLFAILN